MKIIIVVLLIMNLILISFGLIELTNIKNELEPLKLFLRLQSEQNDDLNKKETILKKIHSSKHYRTRKFKTT